MSLFSYTHFSITPKVQSKSFFLGVSLIHFILTLFKVSFLDKLVLAFSRGHLISKDGLWLLFDRCQ